MPLVEGINLTSEKPEEYVFRLTGVLGN